MARAPITAEVKNTAGDAVAGATVTIKRRSDGVNATLYQAETGPTTLSNPLTTDAAGRASCYVDRGAYNATVAGTGISTYTVPINAAPSNDATIDAPWIAGGILTPANIGALAIPTRTGFSGATGVTLSGLNGNADEVYDIVLAARGTTPASTADRRITARPNGLTTNTWGARHSAYAAAAGGNSITNDVIATSGFIVGDFENNASSVDIFTARMTLWASTGGIRVLHSVGGHVSTAQRAFHGTHVSYWSDTTTNLTSLVFDFGGMTASGFAMIRRFGA